jgi:hypothetical protein
MKILLTPTKAALAVIALFVFSAGAFAQSDTDKLEQVVISCESVQLASKLLDKKIEEVKNKQLTDYGLYAFRNLLKIAVKDYNDAVSSLPKIVFAFDNKGKKMDVDYCKEDIEKANKTLTRTDLDALDFQERTQYETAVKQGKPAANAAAKSVVQDRAANSLVEAVKNLNKSEKLELDKRIKEFLKEHPEYTAPAEKAIKNK